MKTIEQIKQDIETKFGLPAGQAGIAITIEGSGLLVPKEKWLEVARFLKDGEYRLDYLSSVTGVDYLQYLEVVYHLFSIEKQDPTPVVIKVRTDREQSHLPSVFSIWRSADFQEREVYDLFGVHFDGHPDLRRILMWDGFEHYPMRKDYVQEDQNRPVEQF